MEEPQIISYVRPVVQSDRANLAPMQFDDYDYVLAFRLFQEVPLEVGRFDAYIVSY